jgi:TetR/AcrR family transcriptional regulator, mexCD-oprJ operon repressor
VSPRPAPRPTRGGDHPPARDAAARERVDGRVLVGRRNAQAIVDAAERLLARGTRLTMAAVAAEAGVSRPTLYAHFETLGQVVEAAVERAVQASMAAFEAARLQEGPADEALGRMLAASWSQLALYQGLAAGASEHLSPGAAHRTHQAMIAPLADLLERGRRDGEFRTDVPADWLVSMYFALVHGADDHVRTGTSTREAGFEMLARTAHDVFAAKEGRK